MIHLDESMVSLVLRQYMRGENGRESLVGGGGVSVMLIRIGKQNVKIIENTSKLRNELFKMS